MKNIKKHVWHYFVYLILFGGGLILLILTNSNIRLETLSLIMIGLLYLIWGMIHHYVHHELHPRIAFEYILVAMLGIILALFLFGV